MPTLSAQPKLQATKQQRLSLSREVRNLNKILLDYTETLLGQTVGNILRRYGILPIMMPREDCPPQEEGICGDWKIF